MWFRGSGFKGLGLGGFRVRVKGVRILYVQYLGVSIGFGKGEH